MSLSPKPFCSVCHASSSSNRLSRCRACSVVLYCGRDHQAAHWGEHKRACNAIKKTQKALSNEESRLRSLPPDMFTPENLFEEEAGHFWSIHETRPYMRARFALVEALLKVKTYAAVDSADAHIMDMLRLCRGDNMGVRDLVPALKLRLGRDQECYDFCKWWATTGQRGDYDWGDMDLPYLDIKGADVLEALPANTVHKYGSLSHTVANTLVKIKLALTVLALRKSYLLAEKVPQDILNEIQEQVVNGTPLAGNKDVLDRTKQAMILQKVQAQTRKLYAAVDEQNKYFWPAMLRPGSHLTTRPEAYSTGSIEHMQIMLQYSYDAWIETPGAFEVIRKLNEDMQRKPNKK